jgi:uncharacterized protein (TIGR03032 family)
MSTSPAVSVHGSEGFWEWLAQQHVSLAFTTYQGNRLFLLGRHPDGRLAVHERLFDKPMGLCVRGDRLYMACRYQLWQFDNRLPPGHFHQGADALFMPSIAYTTGDLSVHEVVVTSGHELLFVNTDFSCLAALCPGHSFQPLWQPPFISKLVAEDRCHLNGLALHQNQPLYATACSQTDTATGWRQHRRNGGVVLHIPSNSVVAGGLSMPHSPRWYRGRLWLLNAGTGEFGYLDGERFVPVLFCPGFARGLAFTGDYAVLGLSKLRSQSFTGLALESRLAEQGEAARCGLWVIDLRTGTLCQWLQIDGAVEELFDVVVLPGLVRPQAIGLQQDGVERLVSFPGSGGLVATKPTAERPASTALPVAGIPKSANVRVLAPGSVKYQQVFHLNPDNLVPYEAFTYPSLQNRWRQHPLRGELLGISAAVEGEMVGLAIAEGFVADHGKPVTELLSLYVLPDCRRQGIGRRLKALLDRQLQLWRTAT